MAKIAKGRKALTEVKKLRKENAALRSEIARLKRSFTPIKKK